MLIMTNAQIWAGALGVPRRTAEIGYGGEAPGDRQLPMNIAGAGVAISGLAGGLFIVLMVLTLLRGKRTDDPELLAPYAAKV
jgi:heme/copper-type cytochrome/quinol oxidase subunit 1